MEQLRGWFHLLFLRNLEDFPREAEKIAKKSRAEKSPPENRAWQGSTREALHSCQDQCRSVRLAIVSRCEVSSGGKQIYLICASQTVW